MRKIISVIILLSFTLAVYSARPIKTVVITGQNNHNWPVSSEAIKLILNNSGLFDVNLAVSPVRGGDMESFNVDFSKYKLVVLDYNGDPWNDDMKESFLKYVRKGGGLIVYHAADNAFAGWEEFNRIIALGGWEGRDGNSGPYVYFKDVKIVKDNSPGPGNIKDLMYTAFASVETRGSGRDEPLVFTVDYFSLNDRPCRAIYSGQYRHAVHRFSGASAPRMRMGCQGQGDSKGTF